MSKILSRDYFNVFIASLLFRLNYSFVTDNYFYGGDIFSRMRIAYNYSFLEIYQNQVDWQPGHIILLKLFSIVFNDFEYFPRLLGIICDAGSISLLFLIAKKLFSRQVAYASALIAGTHYLSIQFSVLTLSGPVYTFFLLLATYSLMQYQTVKSKNKLVIAFVSIFCAEWVRSEAWIFAFIVGLCLIYKKENLKTISVYAFITIIPIVLFLYNGYLITGDLFRFINYSDYEINGAIKLYNDFEYIHYIKRALRMFPFPTIILGIIGFVVFLKKHNKVIWTIPSIVVSFAVFYKLFNLTLMNDPRYFILSSMWFILMTFGSITYFVREKNQLNMLFALGLVIILSNSWQVKEFRQQELEQHPIQFTRSQRKLFEFLKKYNSDDKIYFLGNGQNFIQSALPYITGVKRWQIYCKAPEAFWIGRILTKDHYDSCLKKTGKINTIVTFPYIEKMYGTLGYMIKNNYEEFENLGFNLVFNQNGYKVWARD